MKVKFAEMKVKFAGMWDPDQLFLTFLFHVGKRERPRVKQWDSCDASRERWQIETFLGKSESNAYAEKGADFSPTESA